MSLSGRGPLGLKQDAEARDAYYLAAVRMLPCCICDAWGMPQLSPTTAHHCICGRYGTRKSPDSHAIPLCDGHHQGTFDTSKIAIHRERKTWVEEYGPDTDWIAPTQDKLELLRMQTIGGRH